VTRKWVISLTKLFVGSLPWATNDQQLGDLFSQYGTVLSAKVLMDRATGRSRGFGFVEMEDDKAAQEAIDKLNNTDFQGRKLVVNVARPREER
jgi:RNA recognition motif-containing protein